MHFNSPQIRIEEITYYQDVKLLELRGVLLCVRSLGDEGCGDIENGLISEITHLAY